MPALTKFTPAFVDQPGSEINRNFRDLAALSRDLSNKSILDGHLLKDISVTQGQDNIVDHKLGRKLRGWLQVGSSQGYKTKKINVPVGSFVSSNTFTTIGSHWVSLQFAAGSNTSAHFNWVIPDDFDGRSLSYNIRWTNDVGTALADTETVRWRVTQEEAAVGVAYDAGSTLTPQEDYTQSGAGTDKEVFETEVSISAANLSTYYHVGDSVTGALSRRGGAAGDTYGNLVNMLSFSIEYSTREPIGDVYESNTSTDSTKFLILRGPTQTVDLWVF